MTTPAPQPRRKVSAPVPKRSSGPSPMQPRSANNSPGAAGGEISPFTTTKIIRPRLRARREKIQLIGDSTAGKTYAYLRMAHDEYMKARGANRPAAKFFVIDTDDALPSYLNEGGEFDYLYFENGGNVYPYPALEFQDARNSIASILKEAQDGDWVIMDVVNKFYDQCQQMVGQMTGKDVDDETIKRAINKQGFGGFAADEWNMVNRVFESNILPLVYNPNVHKMFLSHVTEVQGDSGRERREILTMFDQVGLKPRGAPKLHTWMGTVVFLWGVRKIHKDERKRRVGAETVRYMTVVKDLGNVGYFQTVFDRDFFQTLQDSRREKSFQPLNITDNAEAAKVLESVRAEIEERQRDLTADITEDEEDETEETKDNTEDEAVEDTGEENAETDSADQSDTDQAETA